MFDFHKKMVGTKGEISAQKYLLKKGYKILEVNYVEKLGEIDIIAMQKGKIVFIEVKARDTLVYGRPSEAVNIKKQQKIRSIAQIYLLKNKLLESQIRFDVIEIIGEDINHIENAF